MPLPTLDAFKHDTKKVFTTKEPVGRFNIIAKIKKVAHESDLGRGSNIRPIDSALKTYWDNQGSSLNNRVAALRNLVEATLRWLKKKKLKGDTKVDDDGAVVINQVFIERKRAITSLANDALRELYRLLIDNNMLATDNLGRLKFMINKTEKKLYQQGARFDINGNNRARNTGIGQTQSFGPKGLKSLSDSYQFERDSHVANKALNNAATKQHVLNPISGSGVHGTHGYLINTVTTIQASNENRVNQGLAPYDADAKLREYTNLPADRIPQVHRLRQVHVDALTLDDWRILDEIGRIAFTSGNAEYLTRDERFQYVVHFDNMGRLRSSGNALLNAGPGQAYAMDEYGNLLQYDANQAHAGFMYFNHSSFNAGKDIICAGTLHIANGQLRYIDNNTGHYKTIRENLVNCLDVLYCEGVDLVNTIVGEFTFPGGVMTLTSYRAMDFLTNANPTPI